MVVVHGATTCFLTGKWIKEEEEGARVPIHLKDFLQWSEDFSLGLTSKSPITSVVEHLPSMYSTLGSKLLSQ